MTNTEKAKALLRAEGLTCAVCCGDAVYKSTDRGVTPLLRWLDEGTDLHGFSAADKVVGAGAAYLYVLLGVAELYAEVISDAAVKILTRFGVFADFGTCVPYIQNRAGGGGCPIEQAVADATDPQDALARIRKRLAELRK
jgi:hypothetical protein